MKISPRQSLIFFLSVALAWPVSSEARRRDKASKRYDVVELAQREPDRLAEKPERHMMAAVVKAHPGVSSSYAHVSKEGIDVSHYQGKINWDAVAGDGKISYAYLKATEGATLVDDTYARNLSEAKRVGLKVGSYHFYRPNTDWRKQLENLSSVVKPGEQDLLPIIDIEHRGKGSEEMFLKNLRDFITQVTKIYGKKPLLYTFHNFYNRHLAGEFKDYKWMIARYRDDEPTLDDGKDYVIWQYTASGRIAGVDGNVDRSRLMGEYDLGDILLHH